MPTLVRICGGGGGTNIILKEIGSRYGSGNIEDLDLSECVGLAAKQTWKPGGANLTILSFITMDDFSGGTTFRTASGDNNGGSYYMTLSYVDNAAVKCTVTAPAYAQYVGVELYGIYIE